MKTTSTLRSTLSKLFLAIVLIISIAFSTQAQQIEIVIVGSAHSNTDTEDSYRPVIDKLKRYKPDMVFGEYLSDTDMQHALEANHSSSKSTLKKMEYLQALNPKAKTKRVKLEEAYQALDKFAYYHKTRMNLARDLYLNYDRGNAEYQLYVLEQHMQSRFGESEQAYFDKAFGGADSLRSIGLVRRNSEYQKIFFPLMYELGLSKIYPADCQLYDADWKIAWQNALTKRNAMNAAAKADSTSKEAAALKAMAAYTTAANKRMKGIDYNSYEFLNSDLYAEFDEYVNFLGGSKFFDEPGFMTEEVKEMLYWWEKRNQGICENIIRQATEKKAKRVVVAIGSSHRKGMEEIFARMPHVKVVNYNDLP